MDLFEHVIEDYKSTTLSLKAHPVSFIRDKLSLMKITANNDLNTKSDGTTIRVAGLVLVRQRPGTASGICFITIEDETGTSNLVVFKNLFSQYRKEIVHSRLLMVEGKVQKEGEVIHVVVKRCFDLSGLLAPLGNTETRASEDQSVSHSQSTAPGVAKMAKSEIFHGGRNFR